MKQFVPLVIAIVVAFMAAVVFARERPAQPVDALFQFHVDTFVAVPVIAGETYVIRFEVRTNGAEVENCNITFIMPDGSQFSETQTLGPTPYIVERHAVVQCPTAMIGYAIVRVVVQATGLPGHLHEYSYFARSANRNCDDVVNSLDLLIIINAWGPCHPLVMCADDLNIDGAVGVTDLLMVINEMNGRPAEWAE